MRRRWRPHLRGEEPQGFIALTGEVGTGKTTMLECLRDYLDLQQFEFAFVFNSR